MKLPSRLVTLPNGLRAPARELAPAQWQYHLLKHPLGLHRQLRADGRPLPWDREGWSETAPPVVSGPEREAVFAALSRLEVNGVRCAVPEVHGQPPPKHWQSNYGCRECPAPLAEACAQVAHDQHDVGRRYAEHVQALLEGLEDAHLVPKIKTFVALNRAVMRHGADALASCVVASAGVATSEDRVSILRASSGHGIRAEFYRNGSELSWRTCYREPAIGGTRAVSFLGKFASPTRESVSETCLVARHWWEAHGL